MTAPTALLAADDISVRFGGLQALSNVSLTVEPHSTVGLIGPNGAGKTTLINVLSGLAAPTSGRLLWKGEAVRKWRLGIAARHGVARTFQATRVFGGLSTRENVLVAALNAKRDVDVESILEIVELDHRQDVVASELPFGEARRLGVALALATGPEVLLLDEPGAGLTGHDLTALGASIQRVCAEGVAVLLVDHNMRFVMGTADRVVVMESGTVIARGTPSEVQVDPLVLNAYLGRRTVGA